MIARALRRKRNSTKYKEYYSELLRFLLTLDDKEIIKIVSYPTAPKEARVGGQKS
jgi:hypothetical protein